MSQDLDKDGLIDSRQEIEAPDRNVQYQPQMQVDRIQRAAQDFGFARGRFDANSDNFKRSVMSKSQQTHGFLNNKPHQVTRGYRIPVLSGTPLHNHQDRKAVNVMTLSNRMPSMAIKKVRRFI